MARGLFITFEGNEGSGKSTQIGRLASRLEALGRTVVVLREPGGTAIGEEIRHTLKHSAQNHAMTPEAELLLMSASRAQLVRERIRPALSQGDCVLCDRFFDSTTVYQGYGRGLDRDLIAQVTAFAIGETLPDLTLLLRIPLEVSWRRRRERELRTATPVRDRFEEEDEAFYARIDAGYQAVAAMEPRRICTIEASASVDVVAASIWAEVAGLLRLS